MLFVPDVFGLSFPSGFVVGAAGLLSVLFPDTLEVFPEEALSLFSAAFLSVSDPASVSGFSSFFSVSLTVFFSFDFLVSDPSFESFAVFFTDSVSVSTTVSSAACAGAFNA